MWRILFTIVWIICGIFNYGLTLAYLQRKYSLVAKSEYKSDKLFCFFCSLFGSMALIAFFMHYYLEEDTWYGFMYKKDKE